MKKTLIYFIFLSISFVQTTYAEYTSIDTVDPNIALLCETDICSETLHNKCPTYLAIKFNKNSSKDISNNKLKVSIFNERIRQFEHWPHHVRANLDNYYYTASPGHIDIYYNPYDVRNVHYIHINRETLDGTIRYSKRNKSMFFDISGNYDYSSSNFKGEASIECKIDPDARENIYKIMNERERKRKIANDIERQKRQDAYDARELENQKATEKRLKAEQEKMKKIEAENNKKRENRKF